MTSSNANSGPKLIAGAAVTDLTPKESVFLFGYPHVARMSTEVHDALECAALYLEAGNERVLFLANDLICVGKDLVSDVRSRISERIGVPPEAIMITATHTHSGPVTVNYLSNRYDLVVPPADEKYLGFLVDRMVEAAQTAFENRVVAEVGLRVANALGIGTNRHDIAGPADPDVPVLLVRSVADHAPLACMVVYAMHPTVLHEDSTLVSGDFPHFTRRFLHQHVLPGSCAILYHNGASGNLSPRHVTKANTLAEAQRLGEMLGAAIAKEIPRISFEHNISIAAGCKFLDFEVRKFGRPEEAKVAAAQARERLERLRREGAPQSEIRTAECDSFGADETVELSSAAALGWLGQSIRSSMPAEIQLVRIGPWRFLGWPGEFFVEYALTVRAHLASTFVIGLANGELQGYIVTAEAAARGVYESSNALFSPANGPRVVAASQELLSDNG